MSSSLTTARNNDEISTASLTSALLNRMGGVEGFAEKIAADDERLRKNASRNERLIFDRTRFIASLIKQKERVETEGALVQLSEEQEETLLIGAFIRRISKDEQFLRRALMAARQHDPLFFERLLSDVTRPQVIEAEWDDAQPE